MSLKKIIQNISYKIGCKKDILFRKRTYARKKEDILKYYSKNIPDDTDLKDAINYLKRNPLQTFCSDFTKKYQWNKIQVFTDKLKGLPYVLHEDKRLYFIRSSRERTIQYLYSGLLSEQDQDSPHCYMSDPFSIQENDVLLDVGSAEGILSLQYIEKLKQVVLFERDPQWVEALEATFEPWKEKVTIIRKFVSNIDNNENITLDHYLADKDFIPSIIKIDVEGAEKQVLEGMSETMKKSHLKIAVCTYHQEQDFSVLSDLLIQKGFDCQASKGYMLFLHDLDNLRPPFFRRGLIRATT
ncbi:MAG: FkbM family methyltransferase [Bacteroidales bacterium]|nr:FkbM family methyltransferase [Bacteroidales bacterium]